MAEKGGKKKAKDRRAKTAAQPSVLGSLPASRPTRIGGQRARTASERSSATAASRATNGSRRSAPTRESARAKPAAPAAKATPAKAAAGAPAKAAGGPKAVRAGAPRLEGRPRATPPPAAEPRRPSGPPTGTELVTTAIQAAGELAQIGLTVGGQMLKRAVDRLPKKP